MPMLLETHDDLPHIDPAPSPQSIDAATAAVVSELAPGSSETMHPSIDTSYEPVFSPIITIAHESIAATGSARPADSGIDLSRYEEPSVPEDSQSRSAWYETIRQAYISHSYLSQRQLNLSLLERFGKNSWLISNSQLEEELRAIERELGHAKRQLELVDEERRQKQGASKGELDGLDEAWRAGVGRAIEAEVAAEGLRRQVLERRRGGA